MSNNPVTKWILELVDKTTAPIRSIVKEAKRADVAISKIDTRLQNLSNRSSKLQGKLLKIGAAGAAFGLLSMSTNAFEDSIQKANTMMDLSEPKFQQISQNLRAIASNSNIARVQLSEGLYETVSNGVPENNWISYLQDSTKTAIGGQAELGTVVSVTAGIIKNYKESWDQAGLIQDKIQKTVKLGKTNFQEMGQYAPKAIVGASALNVSLDELLGTFGALTGVSGNTAEVSTQMAAIFTAMIKPSAEATEKAKALGIQFDSLAIEKAGGLSNYFTILTEKVTAYANKTGANATNIYASLFGSSEALKAFLPLTSSVAQDWSEKTEQIKNASGTIESAYEQMNNTTSAELQKMRNNWANSVDMIANASKPFLIDLFKIGSGALKVSAGFMQAHPTLTKYGTLMVMGAITTMGMVTAINYATVQATIFRLTLRKVGIRLGKLAIQNGITGASFKAFTAGAKSATFWSGALQAGIRGIGRAIMAIPVVGWIIAGITALIALFSYLWKNFGEFRGALYGVWNVVKFVFTQIGQFVKPIVLIIWRIFKDYYTWLWNTTTSVLSWLHNTFIGTLQGIWNIVTTVFTGIWNVITGIFNKVKSYLNGSLGAVGDAFKMVFGGIYHFVVGVFEKAKQKVVDFVNGIKKVIEPVATFFKGLFGGIFEEFNKGMEQGIAEVDAEKKPSDKPNSDPVSFALPTGNDQRLDEIFSLDEGRKNVSTTPLGGDTTKTKSNSGGGMSLNGEGGKSITMNVTISNYFNNVKKSARQMADEVAGHLVDRLRDATATY